MDVLEVGGAQAAEEVALSFDDLEALPAEARVADVSLLVPGRTGRAVRLSALLACARPRAGASHLHVSSRDTAFAVSVPLAEVRREGLVVYALGGEPLPASKGGPFRLLVPGHADECVNVKALARLELSDRPGRDTRPTDDEEHRRLHAEGRRGAGQA